VEAVDAWISQWLPLIAPTLARIKNDNARWVQIAPVWSFVTADPPTIEPISTTFPRQDLVAHIHAAKSAGLKVALKVEPFPNVFDGPNSTAWYDQFFDQIQSVALYHAEIAQQEGVELLILGDLYFGVDDAGGPPSTYINAKWKSVIATIRASGYTGELTSNSLIVLPEYDWYGDLDYLGDKWWWPVAATDSDTVQNMYGLAINTLAAYYLPIENRFNKPFIFTEVAYYSADTSAMQTYEDTILNGPGIETDPSVPSAYDQQARAYQAVLLALANTPWVQGCYSFGYLYYNEDDKGYSIRDKTAENIMSQIYRQLNPIPPLSIATASPLPSGLASSPYSQTLSATGGVPPYTWSVTSGALPPGLALSSAGVIAGAAISAGVYGFTVQVQDSASTTAAAAFSLTITAPLAITTASPLLSGFTGGAYFQDLTATGGAGSYTWKVTSGSLPPGLTLSGASITGTPTAVGTFTFTLQVSDNAGNTALQAFSLTVVSGAGLARVGVLSHFAAGGSWDTTIWIVNTSATAVPVRLIFHGDDGTTVLKDSSGNVTPTALTATQQGDVQTGITAATLDRALNPNTGLVVGCGLGQSDNVEGWIDVLASAAGVNGFAVFRYAPNGLTPTDSEYFTPYEGTVPLQTQLTPSTMTLPFDNTSGFNNGVAIGTLSGTAATITAAFYDINGGLTLGAPQTITLPANGHTAFLLYQEFPSTANQKGSVVFTGTSLMGLGLRASSYGTLTSVPVILH
jgi:hypothetical protein